MLTFPVLISYVTCPDPPLFWSDVLVISGDIWWYLAYHNVDQQWDTAVFFEQHLKTGTCTALDAITLYRDFFSQNQTPRVLNAYFDRISTTDGYIKAWGPNPPSKPVTNNFPSNCQFSSSLRHSFCGFKFDERAR